MKPFRVRMTDELINVYGLDKKLNKIELDKEYIENVDFTMFHSDDYIDFMKTITPETREQYND